MAPCGLPHADIKLDLGCAGAHYQHAEHSAWLTAHLQTAGGMSWHDWLQQLSPVPASHCSSPSTLSLPQNSVTSSAPISQSDIKQSESMNQWINESVRSVSQSASQSISQSINQSINTGYYNCNQTPRRTPISNENRRRRWVPTWYAAVHPLAERLRRQQ